MRFNKSVLGIGLGLTFIFLICSIGNANAQWLPPSKVGLTQPPPTLLNNLTGKQVNLLQFKGKVLLVNFWASWCEPCRAEFEELIELEEKYGSKGLKVFAINLAEMKPRIMQFLKGNGIPENAIEILLDRNSTAYKSWRARGIPTTFLISKSGKLEAVWIGAIENVDSEEVKDRIEALLR